MRLWITLLLAVCVTTWCKADVDLPTDYRSEQIFLAPQSTVLSPGDTIKIEGVVTCQAHDRMLPYSRYLYIELINGSDIVLTRQKIACDDRGYFRAHIPTDSVTFGEHYLRAYTRLMRNFSLQSFAQLPVYFRKSGATAHDDNYMSATVHPDGGVLVPDIPQRVTVSVTTSGGLPIEGVNVTLTDGAGGAIGHSVTTRSGYAIFNFLPKAGTAYSVSVDGQLPIPLPEADAKTMKLSGRLNGQRLTFEIVGNTAAADSMALYVYDRMNGLSQVYDAGVSGTLSLSHEPVVATLFLVDRRDDRIVSECTVVNTQKPELAISASDSVAAGAYVGYNLAGSEIGSDAVKIVRIVPAGQSSGPMAVEALLYASDLQSDLPFPALAAGNAAQWGNDLAAWAGTARFRRFGLSDVLHNDSTVYRLMPEFTMSLTGRAFRDSRFPMRDGTLVAMNGSNYYTYDTPVSHEGEFEIDVDDFAESTEFFLQYVDKAGKARRADIRIPGDSYPPVEIYRGMARRNNRLRSSGIDIGEEVEGSHRLPDVVVKARATAEKEVPTNRFYGYKAKYREDIEKRHYNTLLDILLDMPTITLIKDPDDTKDMDEDKAGMGGSDDFGARSGTTHSTRWKITTHRSLAMSKKETVRLLIDGSVNDDPDMLDLVFATPAIDIESVEYLSPYEAIALVPFAPAGAITVTTRTLGSPVKRTSKGTIYRPAGLSPVMEKELPRDIAPDKPGQYKLIVDVIDKNGIYSMEHPFTVAE